MTSAIPVQYQRSFKQRSDEKKEKYNLFDVITNPPNQDYYKCKEVSQESRQCSPLE